MKLSATITGYNVGYNIYRTANGYATATYTNSKIGYNSVSLYKTPSPNAEFPMSLLLDNPTLLLTNDGLYCVIKDGMVYIYDIYAQSGEDVNVTYSITNFDTDILYENSDSLYYCGLNSDSNGIYTTKITPFLLNGKVYYTCGIPLYDDNIMCDSNGYYYENATNFTDKIYKITLPYKKQYLIESDTAISLIGRKIDNSEVELDTTILDNRFIVIFNENFKHISKNGDEYVEFKIISNSNPTYFKAV